MSEILILSQCSVTSCLSLTALYFSPSAIVYCISNLILGMHHTAQNQRQHLLAENPRYVEGSFHTLTLLTHVSQIYGQRNLVNNFDVSCVISSIIWVMVFLQRFLKNAGFSYLSKTWNTYREPKCFLFQHWGRGGAVFMLICPLFQRQVLAQLHIKCCHHHYVPV